MAEAFGLEFRYQRSANSKGTLVPVYKINIAVSLFCMVVGIRRVISIILGNNFRIFKVLNGLIYYRIILRHFLIICCNLRRSENGLEGKL
jgi:hypothetical protein